MPLPLRNSRDIIPLHPHGKSQQHILYDTRRDSHGERIDGLSEKRYPLSTHTAQHPEPQGGAPVARRANRHHQPCRNRVSRRNCRHLQCQRARMYHLGQLLFRGRLHLWHYRLVAPAILHPQDVSGICVDPQSRAKHRPIFHRG